MAGRPTDLIEHQILEDLMSNTLTITINAETVAALVADVKSAHAVDLAERKGNAADEATRTFWDGIVAEHGDGSGEVKRGAIVRAVMVAAGVWQDEGKQTDKAGNRTPFGNAVQRMGARYDAARNRAKGATTPDYLALVRQAVKTATDKGSVSADAIVAAVNDTLGLTAE